MNLACLATVKLDLGERVNVGHETYQFADARAEHQSNTQVGPLPSVTLPFPNINLECFGLS